MRIGRSGSGMWRLAVLSPISLAILLRTAALSLETEQSYWARKMDAFTGLCLSWTDKILTVASGAFVGGVCDNLQIEIRRFCSIDSHSMLRNRYALVELRICNGKSAWQQESRRTAPERLPGAGAFSGTNLSGWPNSPRITSCVTCPV